MEFGRPQEERDLDREIQNHLELEAEDSGGVHHRLVLWRAHIGRTDVARTAAGEIGCNATQARR